MQQFFEQLYVAMALGLAVILGVPLLAALLWQERANTPGLIIVGFFALIWIVSLIVEIARGISGRRIEWWPQFILFDFFPLWLRFIPLLAAYALVGYVVIYAVAVQTTGAPPSWLPGADAHGR